MSACSSPAPARAKSSLIRGLATATQAVRCEIVLGSRVRADEIELEPYLAAATAQRAPRSPVVGQATQAGAGYVFLDELTTVPSPSKAPC